MSIKVALASIVCKLKTRGGKEREVREEGKHVSTRTKGGRKRTAEK